MTNTSFGAVMVVGGGIAGIQASLDLADQGYYVYLVEKSAGIGVKCRNWTKLTPPTTALCELSRPSWLSAVGT